MKEIKLSFILFITLLVNGINNTIAFEQIEMDNKVQLRFCYENKELPPHYMGMGLTVPKVKPGAVIDIMQHLDNTLSNVTIVYIREPWKRCLKDLKLGKVDAVIGRYTNERNEFAQYPMADDINLNNALAFSRTSSCLIYHKDLNVKWDGKQLISSHTIGAAVPRGYSVAKDLVQLGVDIYETPNIELAHELLFSGRVQMSLSNCDLKNKPDDIVENPNPISETTGYLIFSQIFYKNTPKAAEYIWRKLSEINKAPFYEKY